MFLIVPIFGAVLVLATFGIGDRLGSRRAGLIGAWLVATSPSMLFHLVEPLTDVPVAGAWAAAFYCLLGSRSHARLPRVGPGSQSHTGAWSALAAGALAGLAILIRPNLVALAGVMGLWYVVRLGRDDGARGRALGHGVLFSLGVAPGIIAVALVNQHLYGSPLTSGYGRLGDQFVSARIWPNLVHYLGWLVQSHTPIVLTGLIAIFVPLRLFWPHVRDRWIFLIVGLFVATLWGIYCAYIEFDAWWYLRFLLPSWPFMMVGVGAVALALARSGGSTVRLLVIGVVVAVGVIEFQWTVRQGAFDAWQGERRYPSVALHVRRLTPENSVILSMQHSGALRYYGGRMTLRYDQIERDWLDRAITWLSARGVKTYLLAEELELASIRERFAGTRALAALDRPPVLIYDGVVRIQLFDLSADNGPPARYDRIRETFKNLRCVPPGPLPRLVLK
jgi:4-amino-4-deoxy-L-arabinose transferase-like glycosyltransferase